MTISQLARSNEPSPTLAMNEEARILRQKGEPVINLGIGEPKNKAPITAILSSAAQLKSGEIKYAPTDGTPSLKKAIIRYTEENYNRLVAPENGGDPSTPVRQHRGRGVHVVLHAARLGPDDWQPSGPIYGTWCGCGPVSSWSLMQRSLVLRQRWLECRASWMPEPGLCPRDGCEG